MSLLRSAAILLLIPAACFVEVPSSRPAGCPDDMGDCDGDGTCETDLGEDKDHCGVCGHGCLGASCVEGSCLPVQLRSGETYPHNIVVDDEAVYWTTGGGGTGNGTVMRVAKSGSAPRTLVNDGYKPRGIAVDDDYVYWSDGGNGSLHRVPKDAMGPGEDVEIVLRADQDDNGESFVKKLGERLYWTTEQAGTVRSAALDGSDVEVLATGQPSPRQMARLGDDLYFTVGEPQIRRVPLAGGAVETLVNADELPKVGFSFGMVALDDVVVFRESDYGAGLNGRVTSFDPDGEDFVVLVESTGARDLVADETHLYWCSDDEGTISRSRHDGSELTVLVTGQNDPTGVAVDDEAVYWTNRALGEPNAGSIWKVAK